MLIPIKARQPIKATEIKFLVVFVNEKMAEKRNFVFTE
jgi:hypothetical protein